MAPRDDNSADLLHPGVGWWTEEEAVFYANPPPLLTAQEEEEDENSSTMMETFAAVPPGDDFLDVEEGFDLEEAAFDDDDDDLMHEDNDVSNDNTRLPLVVELAEDSALGASSTEMNGFSGVSVPHAEQPSSHEGAGRGSQLGQVNGDLRAISGASINGSRTTTAAYEESISYLRNVVYLMWGAPALRSISHAVGGSRLSSCDISNLDIAATPAMSGWSPSNIVADSSSDDTVAYLTNKRSGAALVDIGDSLWKCYVEGLLLLHERMMMEKLLRDISARRSTLRRRHSQISGGETDSSQEDETGEGENGGGTGGFDLDQDRQGLGSANKRIKRQSNSAMSADELYGKKASNGVTGSAQS